MFQLRRWLVCGIGMLAALLAQPLWAGSNTLTRFGPYGGQIYKVAFHPTNPSTLYATSSAGFHRSTDGGASWQIINDQIPNDARAIAVHPSQPDRVFVATSAPGVLASTNAGATLTRLSSSIDFNASGQDLEYSADGSVLYVSTGQQLYRTTDQGATWQPGGMISATPGVLIGNLAVDPTDANRLYMAGLFGEGGFQSADGGATWQAWSAPNGQISEIAIANSQPLRIWVASSTGTWFTDDRGATWTNALVAASTALAIDPNNPNIIYSGVNDGLQVSRDNGVTWSGIQGDAHTGLINCITPHPTDPDQLFLAGRAGLAYTTNAGNIWQARDQGIDSLSSYELVSSAASDRIYINALFDGPYAIDPESSVTQPLRNLDPLDWNLGFHGIGMTVISGQPDRLFLVSSGGIVRSLDGGNTWSQHSVGPEALYRVVNASTDGSRLLASGTSQVYFSNDGGNTWAPGPDVGATALIPMESAPSNPQVIYISGRVPGASSDVILHSRDAGNTWTTLAYPGTEALSIAIDPSDDQTLYVGDQGRVFKSTDGAQTWTTLIVSSVFPQDNYGFRALAIDPQNPNILYVGGLGYVARSVDAGATWQEVWHDQERFPDTRSIAIDALRPHSVYVATIGTGVREITFAPNLGIAAEVSDLPTAYGTAASYSYHVTNAGPFDATNVRTRVELPAGVTNVQAASPTASCTVAGTIVTCTSPILRSHGSADIVVNATHPTSGNFEVVGTVSGDQPDEVSANNSVTSNIRVAEMTDLSVLLTGSAIINRGEATNLSLRVTNAGPNTAALASVRLELGTGMTVASAAPSGGGGVSTCVMAGNTVACQLPQLGAGATVTIAIVTAATTTAGSFTHMATVEASGTDIRGGNNVAAAVTTVSEISQGVFISERSSGGGGGSTSPFMLVALLLLSGLRATANKFARSPPRPLF